MYDIFIKRKMQELFNYVQLLKKKSLLNKFSSIGYDLTDHNYKIAKSFPKKNNFSNILATESTRIKLQIKNSLDSNYINANFILDNYIATQEPNIYTQNDFWKMIYENKCPIIINLTKNNDYLSFEESKNIDDFTIKITNLKIIDNIEIRILNFQKNTNVYEIISTEQITDFNVYHITFLKWDDFGIPKKKDFFKLLEFINLLNYSKNKNIFGKIVIHCRAGVGRTGTLIFIHYILKKINEGIYIDPIKLVKEMRRSRSGMIQGNIQFKFAISIIIDLLTIKMKNLKNNKNNLRLSNENYNNKYKNITKKKKLRCSCGDESNIINNNYHININQLKEIEI